MRWFLFLVEPRPCDRSRTGVHHAGTGMVPPQTSRHPAVMPLLISTALSISSGWAPWLIPPLTPKDPSPGMVNYILR